MAVKKKPRNTSRGSPRSIVLVVLFNIIIAGVSIAAGVSYWGVDNVRSAASIGFGAALIVFMFWLTSKLRK